MADDNKKKSDFEKTTVITRDSVTQRLEAEKLKEIEACLIIIRGTPQGKKYPLTTNNLVIGRDVGTQSQADVRLNDRNVSRKHAQLVVKGEQVFFEDLGSTNGSFVNDIKLEPNKPVELSKEDIVKTGNTLFKYLPKGSIEIISYDSATMDAMTQIYNKKFIMESLEAEFHLAVGLNCPLSIVIFDIDHFKKINDTHGHDAGDFVLKELVKVMKTKGVRGSDILGRYGGEEFLLILPDTDVANAQAIAERMRAAAQEAVFTYEGKAIPVTVSLGVSTRTPAIDTHLTFFKNADKALYESKHGGRNRVTVG